MKLREIARILNTDEYIIIDDKTEEAETIRDYESGSHTAIKKYFDREVKSITPCGNSVEIRII